MGASDTSKIPVDATGQQLEAKPWAARFFTIWIGQALSLVGSQMGGFALVWWLTQASGGSATVLATSSLVATLPMIFLGPFAGALVDRWSRRSVMIVADSLVAAFSALLAVLAWTDALQIWHIYGIVFVRALGGTFHFAAMQAATSLMVPSDQLARVSGMNQVLHGALGIITPPLGALAISMMPLYAIMGIDVVTAAFAIAPLFFVHIPDPVRGPQLAEGSPGLVRGLLGDVREGLVYVWRWTGLFIVLVVAALLNGVINPAFALMPILVKEHFGGDVLQLGWAESAWGIGLIVGGLLLAVWGGFKRKIYTSLLGLAVAGFSFAAVGLAPAAMFNLALAGLFVAGLSNPIINGPFLAIVQSAVAPEVQGRVFTAISSLSGIAAPVGMLIAGPLADALGVQVWFLIGGAISVAMSVGLRAIPAVMHLEDYRREPTVEPPHVGSLSQASE